MKLSALLSSEQIILDLRATEHWDAITEMIDYLDGSGGLGVECREEVLTLLKTREDQTSTGIGSGVAIPHAFCEQLEDVVCVFSRSKEGVDFHAIDHAPVHFIVLFLVPKKQYGMHLQTLAAIAKMFKNCETRRQLHEAESREEILAILDAGPTTKRNVAKQA